MEKRCWKCKSVKELSEFYKNAAQKDGHSMQCKLCQHVLNKIWRKKNPDKTREYSRIAMKRWADKNRDYYNAYARKWHKENHEHFRAYIKAWREKRKAAGLKYN